MARHSVYGRALSVDETGSLASDDGVKTTTAVGTGATSTATLNKSSGKITSASLTTAFGATHTLTLTNSKIKATDVVLASVGNVLNTGGMPNVASVTPANGSVVIVIQNIHASTAFNQSIAISFLVLKV